jgi:hypothetical protein
MPETMDIASALDHYRTARALLESDPATPTASYLYTGLAAAALYSLDNAEGLEAATRGMESSRGHDSATAMAIALRGAHRAYLGEVDDGFAELEQAWALADATGAAVPAFLAAWMRGWGAMLLLDPADARTWCDRELGTRRMERMPRNRDTLRATRAISGLLQGMPGDDELDMEPGANVPLFEPLCAMRRGEWDDASEVLAAGVASVIQAGNRADEYLLTYWLGHLHRVRGDVAAARTVLQHLLASDEDHGALPPCHELVVRAELARLDDAHTQLPRCHEIMGTRDWHGLTGRVGLAQAVDAASRGRPDAEVDDAFRGAIDVFAAKGLRWDEADAALEWASAMDRSGRHTEAGRLRDGAAASYRSMGAPQPWLDRIGAFA